MALTTDLLKSNEQLKDLPENVLTIIATLSSNDESRVIDQTVKGIHDQYDKDILDITGNAKPGGVKSYDHLKLELTRLKELGAAGAKAGEYQKQVEGLKADKLALEEKIKKGSGDDVLKGQLEAVQKQVADKTTELRKFREAAEAEKTRLSSELAKEKKRGVNMELVGVFDQYLAANKIKFKPGFPARY